jgi:1,4-dihydroxy-2-naphthoate polyprenyltransferase
VSTAESVAVAQSRPALYWRATRPLYLPTSVVPAAAGALVALGNPDATWWLMPVALLALLLVHAGTDVVNDVEDFARGTDPPGKRDNSRVFTGGLLTVREGRALGLTYFAAAALLGTAIAALQGPAVLVYGVLGVVGGYLYTGGPWPYKYAGLGDLPVVFLMGPLMTQGAYSAVTGEWFSAPAFFCGLVPGLIGAAVLQGNNLSDMPADAAAGARTLAVRLGFPRARALYLSSLAMASASVLALWAGGLFGAPILLVLATLPLALRRARQAMGADGGGDPRLLHLAPLTAHLQTLVGAALVIGVILDRGA